MSDDESSKVKPFDFSEDSDSVGRSTSEQDVSLDEMLSLACRQGKLDIVELLLQSGAKVNHRNKAGNTPLLEACSQGHVNVSSYLLENGADIDSPTETTLDSALTWACTLGNVKIVDLLLSKKADVEHRTKDGCTALMFACLAGHVEVAEKLLDNGAEINVESDSNKDSPLTFACWKGHESVVELLLKRNADIEHRTKEGFSPLMFAALGGHTEVASKLLQRKALVNVPSGSNNDIPLTSACWKGHHNVVKLLLKHTSNIEHRTKDGCTPLMLAAREGHFCVAKLLLEHGAQVNIPSGSENNIPLTLACWKGHTKVVELLLEHQSNIEHRNKAGCTPLMLAAREGHLETTMLLLQKNAQVNVPSGSNDDTPLTLACWKGHYKVVELLLQCQSNVDHQTKTGCTPLMEATREGHRKVAEILLDYVADVELPDNYGQSPLFMACWKGHRNVAELLLQRNANRDSRTRTGITPLFQACRENHVEIVDLLISYGASVNSPFPNSRENPLTLAAEKGHIELVRLLIEKSANHDCHTKKGCTPFFLACKEGHKEIAEELKKHGSEIEAPDCRGNTPIMASFKNGHVQVVEWLIKQIYHLPSDEMCHKILMASVDEKDREVIMQRRSKCLATIQEAKKSREQQALRNAQILVQELDEEKCREEKKKKKQAAKRRDKRKRKKPPARDSEADGGNNVLGTQPLENRFEDSTSTTANGEQDDYCNDKEGGSSEPDFMDDNEEEELKDKSMPQENREDPDQMPADSNHDWHATTTPDPDGHGLIVNSNRTIECPFDDVPMTVGASLHDDVSTHHPSSTPSSSDSHDNDDWQGVEGKDIATSSRRSGTSRLTSTDKKHSQSPEHVNESACSSSFYDNAAHGDSPSKHHRDRHTGTSSSSSLPASSSSSTSSRTASCPGSSSYANSHMNSLDYHNQDWKDVLRTAKTLIIQLSVPNSFCGRVIGRGGTKINSITDESGAQITVNKPEPQTPNDRLITIKGSPPCVENAKQLVTEALNSPSIFQQTTRPSLTLGGFIDPKTTFTLGASQGGGVSIVRQKSLPVGVKSSGESSSDWPRSIGVSTSAQNTSKASVVTGRASISRPGQTSTTSSSDSSCKASYSSYSNVITGQTQREHPSAPTGHEATYAREQSGVVGSGDLTSDVTTASQEQSRASYPPTSRVTGSSPPLRDIASVAVCTQSETTSTVSHTTSRSIDAVTSQPRSHDPPQQQQQQVRASLDHQLAPTSEKAPLPASTTHVPSQNQRQQQQQHLRQALSQTAPSSSFGAIGDSRSHTKLKDVAPIKSAPPATGDALQQNDFSYFSPWTVQTPEVKKRQDSSTSSVAGGSFDKKGGDEGPLQSFTSLVQSSLYSRDIPPYPWQHAAAPSRDDRSRSISWAGNSGEGDDQNEARRDATTLDASPRSASSETLQERSPGTTLPWGAPLSLLTKNNSEEAAEEHVFADSMAWQTKPSDGNSGGCATETWDRTSSPTSSLSSSRQELNSILDNNDGALGSGNAWSQTPSSDHGQGGSLRRHQGNSGLSFADTAAVDNRQWSSGQEQRGAYSAPSSPAVQRTDDNPTGLQASSADLIRSHPSVDELGTKSWFKNGKTRTQQQEQLTVDASQWNSTAAQGKSSADRRSSNNDVMVSPRPQAPQDSHLPSPRISVEPVTSNELQSMSEANARVTIPVATTTTTTKTSWRPERFEDVGTISELLGRLSLGKYTDNFIEKQVNLPMLLRLEESDLQRLGIPKGPRLKIMKASEMMKSSYGDDVIQEQQQRHQQQQQLQSAVNQNAYPYTEQSYAASPYTVAMTPNNAYGPPPSSHMYSHDSYSFASSAAQQQQQQRQQSIPLPMPIGPRVDYMSAGIRPPPPTIAAAMANSTGAVGSHQMRFMYHDSQPAYYYYPNPQGPQ